MTNLRQAAQQAEPCIGKDPRCPCQDGDACHYKDCGDTKAWPVPQAEPTPWRDMVVVNLVREGIDKHRARELADHFAAQPEQRKPLTDEEIQAIWDVAAGAIPGWSRHIAYARAIEAAHGIKEGT